MNYWRRNLTKICDYRCHPVQKRMALLGFLAVIAALGLTLRVREALDISTLLHPDEVFQTLEPAHSLAFGYGVVTWEWRDGIRSPALPQVLAELMRLWLHMVPESGPRGYLIWIRVLLSLLSMSLMWTGYVWTRDVVGSEGALIAAIGCAIWWELVKFAPATMPEAIATHLLLPGLYLLSNSRKGGERAWLCCGGILCGTAMSLRIQLVPVVAVAYWLVLPRLQRRARFVPIVSLMIVVGGFGLLDRLAWGHAFQSFYLYFWENIVQGRSRLFGTEPWYWYATLQVSVWGPLLFFAAIGARKARMLGWCALALITSHSLISHKELRFLYPVDPMIIILSTIGLVDVSKMVLSQRLTQIWVAVATTVVAIMLYGGLSIALSRKQIEPFVSTPNALGVMNWLSDDNTVCGVGLYGIPWFMSGGYSYLHKSIPIVILHRGSGDLTVADSVNTVLVSEADVPQISKSYKKVYCQGGECVWQRQGACFGSVLEINAELKANGI